LSERQKEIIKKIGSVVAAGGLVTVAVLFPNIIGATYRLSKQIEDLQDAASKYRLKQSIKRLEKKGLIYLEDDEIKLTKRGKEILKFIKLDDLIITKPSKWDGVWHLVCYDIPERHKRARESFRTRLMQLNFAQIQDSLWVHPYECQDEVSAVSQILDVSHYVVYLNTNYLPQEKRLMKRFNL